MPPYIFFTIYNKYIQVTQLCQSLNPTDPHQTLQHIGHCLDKLEQVRHLAANSDAVELALWYHDAIYDTKAKDSEEQSAALAVGMVRRASLPDNLGQSVANLIMATKHSTTPTDSDYHLGGLRLV